MPREYLSLFWPNKRSLTSSKGQMHCKTPSANNQLGGLATAWAKSLLIIIQTAFPCKHMRFGDGIPITRLINQHEEMTSSTEEMCFPSVSHAA